eukprot:8047268-Alexandrium_andersonii.AAC.1
MHAAQDNGQCVLHCGVQRDDTIVKCGTQCVKCREQSTQHRERASRIVHCKHAHTTGLQVGEMPPLRSK